MEPRGTGRFAIDSTTSPHSNTTPFSHFHPQGRSSSFSVRICTTITFSTLFGFLPGFWLRGPQFVLIGHATISSYLPVTKESSIWVDRKLEVCEGTLRLRRMKEIQISLPSFPQLRKKNEKTSVYRRWFPLVF